MGFNTSGQNRRFATISEGKIVVSHLNPIEGVTETRLNKNGKQVHEQKFNSYTGYITGIHSKETSFGKVWEVSMKDGEEEVVISWNYSSRYTNNFFRALPNVVLSKEVTLNPWSMKDKNDATKKVIGLSLLQDGKKVPYKWDRENPGDMPDLKKIKVKGKEEWDDSDQLLFFEKYLKKHINFKTLEEAPF